MCSKSCRILIQKQNAKPAPVVAHSTDTCQRTELGEVVWAIPVALSDSHCATIRRLWILERAGDGVWRMVAKSRLFTYIPVEANGDSVRRLSDQIIIGEV
jgi:hypothetical protein